MPTRVAPPSTEAAISLLMMAQYKAEAKPASATMSAQKILIKRSEKISVCTRRCSLRRCADSMDVCSKTQLTRSGAMRASRSSCSIGKSGQSVVVDYRVSSWPESRECALV